MKQRNLMYLLQSQGLLEETPNQTSTNMSCDNSQLRSLIENGDNSKLGQQVATMVGDLHKELLQMLLKLSDQIVSENYREDVTQMISNIRAYFQLLMQEKFNLEEVLKKRDESEQSDYEKQLQKLEAEIRSHIRVEQQLKLYAETTQSKLDESTKLKDQLEIKLNSVSEELKKQIEQSKKLSLQTALLEKDLKQFRGDKKRQLHKQEPRDTENQTRPIMINLLLDHLNRPDKANNYRVQTEPADDVENINRSNSNSVQKQQHPFANEIRYHVRTESNYFPNGQVKVKQQGQIPQSRSKRMLTTDSQKENSKLKRHGSNKSYIDASQLSKSKLDNALRQKSLTKYSQNSLDQGSYRHKAKTSSICNTMDVTHPSFRPFSSMEQPIQDLYSNMLSSFQPSRNESRTRCKQGSKH